MPSETRKKEDGDGEDMASKLFYVSFFVISFSLSRVSLSLFLFSPLSPLSRHAALSSVTGSRATKRFYTKGEKEKNEQTNKQTNRT